MPLAIKPLKKYGQNFLTDKHIAGKIIDALEPPGDEIIVEIGAGSGMLTELLFHRDYKHVIALEIDARFIMALQKRYGGKITILQQSILDFSFKELSVKYNRQIKIIGNIPYYITSPILFKLIENDQYISQAILMVQKEIAERLLADTCCKAYGILTVLAGYHAKIRKLFDVKRAYFYPQPQVDSTVIKMEMGPGKHSVSDYHLFRSIVHLCFNTRRKMMQNSLKKILSKDEMNKIKSVPLTARPEELSLQHFLALTDEIAGIIKKERVAVF
jgi:16S rRNA (adenine1518-N6/adenine1519-N6)-dimethyltransferase